MFTYLLYKNRVKCEINWNQRMLRVCTYQNSDPSWNDSWKLFTIYKLGIQSILFSGKMWNGEVSANIKCEKTN